MTQPARKRQENRQIDAPRTPSVADRPLPSGPARDDSPELPLPHLPLSLRSYLGRSATRVADKKKAKQPGGHFCKVVRRENVLVWEKEREKDQAAGVEEEELEEEETGRGRSWRTRKLEEEELWDHRKRVKADQLVSLYVALQDGLDIWYDIWVPEDGEINCF